MNQKSITPNPYDVLEVLSGASNAEITKAFAQAMKCRKYPPDAIALARKSLMNPQERIIADYLRPILASVKRFKRSDFSALDTPAPKLEFLAEFDGLDTAIADSNKVSESDQRLGAMLFTDSPIQTKITQDNSFAESSTEYSHSFVKKKQDIEDNPSNSKTISILPWLSVLFIFLLLLFVWGVFNKFQNTASPQVKPTPTEIEVSSQPTQSQSSIPQITTNNQTIKPKPEITSTRSNSSPRAYSYNFPLNSCGDKDPGGTNSWYPVYVEDTEENLSIIQNNYCQDAFRKYRKERKIQSIQVASFLNRRKAQEFANLMKQEIGSGEVGEPSVYYFSNKSVVGSYKNSSSSYQRPSPTQFVKNYYVNLSYRNYQTTWNQLSSSFKRKTEGYSEYVNWWDSIREIRIEQIRLIEQNNDEALVFADLTYITNTGTYYNDTKNRIYLIWDSQSSTWLFEKKF